MSILALTACSDDDDDRVVRPVEFEKHFTGNDLDLKLSGEKVIGKDILFTPDATVPEAATLTFMGQRFDVDAAMNGGARAEEMNGYLTSSVFAGEPQVKLPITMNIQGDMGSFEGNNESKYYTYNYKGQVLENQLAVEISNVLLKNQKLAGTTWALEPLSYNEWGNLQSIPLISNWESDKNLVIDFGFGSPTEYTMTQILTLVVSLPFIPVDEKTNISVGEIIGQLLHQVKFESDGSLIATYLDRKTNTVTTSPKGIANYVVEDDNNLKLILNPFAIDANVPTDKDQNKEPNQMSEIMKGLAPMILEAIDANAKLSEGINMKYTMDGDKLQVCVDETLLLPVLKLFAPMLQNPDLINTIMEKVKQNPDMAALAPMLEMVLKQIPDIVNSTTKIEIGLKFVKK